MLLRRLLSFMRASFLERGGVIYEGAAFSKAEVFTDAVLVRWPIFQLCSAKRCTLCGCTFCWDS